MDTDTPSNHSIGDYAGLIWNYLNSNGSTSIIKLKSEINCSASLVHLALGWLTREGKVEFKKNNGHLYVNLTEGDRL